jgi:DNA-binding NarL/FixJ family response regulator
MRILIVDDLERTRQSLTLLLNTLPDIKEVRAAANGQEAVELIQDWLPDLVVMDARMPKMDGVEATRLIKAKWPGVKVIVLSMYPEYHSQAIQAGADAFISKGAPAKDLLDTICEMLEL